MTRRVQALFFVAAFLVVGDVAAIDPARDQRLTFEDRVWYQRLIEEVYWEHRIWPDRNPGPKPMLDEVLPEGVLRARVASYLEKSAALERIWSDPLTGDQLQAELDRMVRDTNDPAMLAELFAALGDDPFLIAECLVRPVLVDRMIRDRHAGVESRNERSFDAWWARDGRSRVEPAGREGQRSVLPSSGAYEAPAVADTGCTEDTWTGMSTTPTARSSHAAVWTGAEMFVWGGFDGTYLNTGGRYDPATDSWTPTSMGTGVPSGRWLPTVEWNGTEVIVWGGIDAVGYLSTGGRYDPTTDSWTATSTGTGVPDARYLHSSVWTGTEMIVWGGEAATGNLNTGGRYDPATDSWSPTSTGTGVPAVRHSHTGIWTGTEMIVWGGEDLAYMNTGGRYDPATDSWTATSVGIDVPTVRRSHSAVWAGTEMIVWGGFDDAHLNSGGRYDPATDSWTPTSTGSGVPSARQTHPAVWTGAEMVVWGGYDGVPVTGGSRYRPATDSWTTTSATGMPAGRFLHTAVWTGSEMIVWAGDDNGEGGGGFLNDGGRYCACSSGTVTTVYLDEDGDGFGVDATTIPACSPPPGYAAVGGDCDDTDSAINPGGTEIPANGIDEDCNGVDSITCYADGDGDAFGDPLNSVVDLDAVCDTGFVTDSTDCDDTDSSANPNGTEVPDNGIDEDCSGTDSITCYADTDGDTFGDPANSVVDPDASCDTGFVPDSSDCNDADGSINPNGTEIPDNGIDENCDGSDGSVCYVDSDGDGFGDPLADVVDPDGACDPGTVANLDDCDDSDGSINPNGTEIPDNGVDEDCSGVDAITCYADTDGDGFGDAASSVIDADAICDAGFVADSSDCDDADGAVNPSGTEIPGNGIDEDCNGVDSITCYADSDGDTFGDPLNSVVDLDAVCDAGFVLDNTDCDDTVATCTTDCSDGNGNGTADCAETGPDELSSDFGANGLWHYTGSWSRLTTWNATLLAAWDTKLVAGFGEGDGMWTYQSGSWNRLTTWNPTLMVPWGDQLATGFGSNRGTWVYGAGGWNKLTSWDPEVMVVWGDKLVVGFGMNRGTWTYDGGWTRLTSWDPQVMIEWGADLVVSFGSSRGTWRHDGNGWSKLTSWDAEALEILNDDLTADFGDGRGLWRNASGSWSKMSSWNPEAILAWGDALAADFGDGRGLWRNDAGVWTRLTSWDPVELDLMGSELSVAFGAGRGLWNHDTGSWRRLTSWDPEQSEAIDVN